MAAVVGRFIQANKRASRAVERRLPQARIDLQAEYERVVAEYMNARPGLVVVDVGGGKRCHFARFRDPALRTTIVAVDVSAEELAHNADVDEKQVADAQQGLPFADESVDLVVSRSVLEHLRDTESFVRHAERVLKRGGHFIHVLPSKFSPHSVANQLLPRRLSQRLLHTLIPGSQGRLGFPAYYDRCTPGALERLLDRNGFEVVELRLGYYQSEYYDFFLPLYLLSAGYELLVRALRARPLAAAMLVVARKR